MSSAAMQAAPQQAPASIPIGSDATTTTMAPRNYQQSAPSRDAYNSQPPVNAQPSPSSSRRPSKRPSGNEASSTPNSPQQAQYQSPMGSTTSNLTTPRGQPAAQTAHVSPSLSAAVAATSRSAAQASQAAQPSGGPIPPRTSSNQPRSQHNSPSTGSHLDAATSRRAGQGPDGRPTSSRNGNNEDGRERGDWDRGAAGGHTTGGERERERQKDDATSAAAAAARSRRKPQQSPRERPRTAPNTHDGSGPEATQSHSAQQPTGSSIPREGSAVLNRVVVTDPQVDLSREHERMAESRPTTAGQDVTPVTGLGLVGSEGVEDGGRGGGKSRQDHSAANARRKETKFGEYILGQTLGEGEFGKVKMGWKKEGGVQVAIKLIRRESLGSNPSRLPKIYREISILRGLSHPNIVRLHEMVETERHIGIILEYASGGELFDYILNHRYLKDNAARRLFAQLVSGVGYLHKKGIVHRDLKLENLLLDRNRNIIITDFGFANTFDPFDDLGDEIEYNLTNRDFVKKMDLERVRDSGHRRGDLMQTSCGSPCYAAPELVVSDSLYTGRKVDVWSCGVILYAMLAGYLPFDDDPANPEGDNINLLYKYIVSTPLTFPEYVTPHARDLLRRILVPDPRKRADLFEVARHSWLSEYSHVVSFITSSTTTTGDIANTTVTAEDAQEVPLLARSASVREPTKAHQPRSPVGGLSQKHAQIDPEQQNDKSKTQRDAKRRTVQVEYVPPQSQTARGENSASASPTAPAAAQPVGAASASKTRARHDGPVDVPKQLEVTPHMSSRNAATTKPLPKDPPGARASRQAQTYTSAPVSGRSQQRPQEGQHATRAVRDLPRSVSEATGAHGVNQNAGASAARPATGKSMGSIGGERSDSVRLPSRGNSYGLPVAPAVAATNAQGRLAQPKNGKQYVISSPIPQQDPFIQDGSIGRPSTQQLPVKAVHGAAPSAQGQGQRGHKRSNTVGGISEKIFGRSASLFGGRPQTQSSHEPPQQRPQKSYPPTSMSGPIATAADMPRPSTDSRRSSSFGFVRKNSDLAAAARERPRRFSLLPASFSFKSFAGTPRDHTPPGSSQSMAGRRGSVQVPVSRGGPIQQEAPIYARDADRSVSGSTEGSGQLVTDGQYERIHDSFAQHPRMENIPAPSSRYPQQQSSGYHAPQLGNYSGSNIQYPSENPPQSESGLPTESESSLNATQGQPQYPPGFNSDDDDSRMQRKRSGRGPGVLQKNNRKFTDAYEQEQDGGYGQHSAGSSGAARKVMDFFRRRGRAREMN